MSEIKKLESKLATAAAADNFVAVRANNNSESGSTVEHRVSLRQETNQSAQESNEVISMARKAKQHKKWNRRLKIFFCCLGYKKNKDSIADIAGIFAEFYADLNVPSSDVAAGFVLLSKYQAAQRQWIVDNNQLNVQQYLSSIPITNQTNFLDISTAEDSHLINDLIYYMNYSLAIFGWPLQAVDEPCVLCCLFPYLRFCRCCSGEGRRRRRAKVATIDDNEQERQGQEQEQEQMSALESVKETSKEKRDKKGGELNDNNSKNSIKQKQQINSIRKAKSETKHGVLADDCNGPIILDDNCCGCNAASVEQRLAAHNYEIIYITYRVDVNIIPFLVVADHSKQSVVVALRGSMSLSDMVTDMNGQADRMPMEDCPDNWLSHRGITKAATNVRTTLINEHILERAFNCRPDLGSKDYTLVFCGHSLGAGVAAILGILLRKQYPALKAYLYSPPGGLLSLPAVEYTKQFATGIILGNDCVARLGIAQLERLRYHVLLSLKSSEQSTCKILTKATCPTFCFGRNKVEYDPNKSLNLLHGVEGRSFDYNGIKIPFQVQPQILYVPGKIVHIVKNHSFKTSRRFFNEPIYQAIWADNTSYDRIFITKGMLFDHLPYNLMHAMKMLFSKTLPGRKDSKTSSSIQNDTYTGNQDQSKQTAEVLNNQELDPKILGDSKECEFVIENYDNNNNKVLQQQYDSNSIQTIKDINQPSKQVVKIDLKTKNDFPSEELLKKKNTNNNNNDQSFDKNGNDNSFSNKEMHK